jgi:alpha-methylacyl-CoA racemase
MPPINLVGDFGGGGMFLAFGVVCALMEATRSGRGQVVDAAMVDGSAVLMTMMYAFVASGLWADDPGTNLLDTGAHFYEVYETSDGKYMAVGGIESQFYAELIKGLGLSEEELPWQMDRSQWPAMKERFAELFRTRTRDGWTAIFEGTDACVAPVLSMSEARDHPHIAARQTFVTHEGIVQPAPAPRFSRTKEEIQRRPPALGEHTDEVLAAWGFAPDEIAALHDAGAIV